MKVAVFDVDGTLTMTKRIDGSHFASSVESVLGERIDQDWTKYREATDAAILAELCEAHPTAAFEQVEATVRERFVALLEETTRADPMTFRPVRGAQGVFDAVRVAGWSPAIATGGWRRSAEIKLRGAGIATAGVPFASCSDHSKRVDIVREAVRMAAPDGAVDGVVVIGDAAWDLRASRVLGYGFVGRAEGDAASSLLALGADFTVPDFADAAAFVSALEAARLTRRPARGETG